MSVYIGTSSEDLVGWKLHADLLHINFPVLVNKGISQSSI